MDRDERIAVAFEKLFRTYQQSGQGEAGEVLLDRLEKAKVYFEAVEPYDVRDIEAAAHSFLTGSAPGVNPAFLPPAPSFAGEVRRLMNLRVTSEARDKALRPALPPPDIERSAESQQRVRDLMERTVNGLKAMSPDEDPQERHRKMLRRTNEYFDGERERGFTVGDDGEEAA